MKTQPLILLINGGASSIKFALFEAGVSLGRILSGALDEKKNAANNSVISTDIARVAVHVIRTDIELMIAKMVCRVLGLGSKKEK